MGYDPKNIIEKFAFKIAGINRIAISQILPAGEMSAVANFWLARSNTSTVFSTICLTSAIVLFVETKNWLIFTPFLIGSIFFGIRVWVYEKCAYQALKLWT